MVISSQWHHIWVFFVMWKRIWTRQRFVCGRIVTKSCRNKILATHGVRDRSVLRRVGSKSFLRASPLHFRSSSGRAVARDSLGMFCFTFPSSEKSKEVRAKLTSTQSNSMVTIDGVLDGYAHPILRTFPRVIPCRHGSKVDAKSRRQDFIAGSENHRWNGVDNSATWFVEGMIHRQRRK